MNYVLKLCERKMKEKSGEKLKKSWKKLFDNFRLDHFKIEVNYENVIDKINKIDICW